jgi:hypothetical protein
VTPFCDDHRVAPARSGVNVRSRVHRCPHSSALALELRERRQRRVLDTATAEVVAIADELAAGTIDKIMGKSDLELGIGALLGKLPPH